MPLEESKCVAKRAFNMNFDSEKHHTASSEEQRGIWHGRVDKDSPLENAT